MGVLDWEWLWAINVTKEKKKKIIFYFKNMDKLKKKKKVIYFNNKTGIGILKVERDISKVAWSAVTMIKEINEINCRVNVIHLSGKIRFIFFFFFF